MTTPKPGGPAESIEAAFMEWFHRSGIGTRDNPKLAWHAAVEWATKRLMELAAEKYGCVSCNATLRRKLLGDPSGYVAVKSKTDTELLIEFAERYETTAAGPTPQPAKE